MRNKTIAHFKSIIENSSKLNNKEKDILIKRIEGNTLETIGKKYKISAERVRQKEEVAIIKFVRKICQLLLFENNSEKKIA
ncbi:MAG: sigma factor-like helix-turn-helix DNA-binding protein [bacterium]|nr:sigma factor-like helix-turn-helix DNA-binding protein [bacterium]